MAKTEIKADQLETASFESKVEIAVTTGEAADDLVNIDGDTMTGGLTVPDIIVETFSDSIQTSPRNFSQTNADGFSPEFLYDSQTDFDWSVRDIGIGTGPGINSLMGAINSNRQDLYEYVELIRTQGATGPIGAGANLIGVNGIPGVAPTGGSSGDDGNLQETLEGIQVNVDALDIDIYNVSVTSQAFTISDATDASKLVVTNGSGTSSIKIDTSGGVDIDVDAGFRVDENNGAVFSMSAAGVVQLSSASGQDVNIIAGDQVKLTGGSSGVSSIQLEAASGGIDMDADNGVTIDEAYIGAGTGNGITLTADVNNAGGTGGDIILSTTATSGTPGDIVINSAGGIDVDTAEGFIVDDDSGSYLRMFAAGSIYIRTASNQALSLNSDSGTLLLGSSNTGATAIQITSSGGGIDIDAATGKIIDIDGGAVQINADAASNFTVSNAALLLQTTGSGDVDINPIADLDVDSVNADFLLTGTGTSSFKVSTAGGMFFDVNGTDDNVNFDIEGLGTDSFKIDTVGGVDIDVDEGLTINDNSGGYIYLTANGGITLFSPDGQGINLYGDGTSWIGMSSAGKIDLYSDTNQDVAVTANGTGNIALTTTTSTDTNSIDITATTGGVDIDTALGVTIDEAYTGAGTGNGITVTADVNNASGTGGDIILSTTATSGTPGKIEFYSDSSMRLDTATGFILWELVSVGIYQGSSNVGVQFSGQIANLKAERGINITNDYDTTGTSGDIIISSQNSSTGTGADIVLQTTGGAGTPGRVEVQTAGFVRVIVGNDGDTIFYGTASTSGALPVITIDQADTDEPFLKFIGDAASADLTRDLIDTGDVTTPTIVGYLKIEILDDGDQITDGDYFVPFYSLA